MGKKILVLMVGLGAYMLIAMPGAFAIMEAGEEAPSWFPLLEVIGSIVGIYALIYAYKTYTSMKGGAVGEVMKYVALLLVFVISSLIFHALQEHFGVVGDEFAAELIFEVLIYAGIIVLALGIRKVYKMSLE